MNFNLCKKISLTFRTLFLLSVLLNISSIGNAEQIKVYLDKTFTNYILAEQQDCSVHKKKDGTISLGFKVGGLFWGVGPEISFSEKTGVKWHHTIQGFISKYQELCAHFNTGTVSKAEYDMRLLEIEKVEQEAYDLYLDYLKRKEKRKIKIFDELDNKTLFKN